MDVIYLMMFQIDLLVKRGVSFNTHWIRKTPQNFERMKDEG